MSAPRKHHTVPAGYQRRFANGKDQVRVHVIHEGRQFTTSVLNVLKEGDFYSYVDEHGALDTSIETFYADHIDGPGAAAMREVAAHRFAVDSDRFDLANWIAAQICRGPEFRESVQRPIEQMNRQVLALTAQHYSVERWQETIGEIPPAALRRRWARGEGIPSVRMTKPHLMALALQMIPDVADYVALRTWHVIEFDEPALFTTNYPVVLLSRSGASVGVGTADVIYLPLSPTQAFVARHPLTRELPSVLSGTTAQARRLNLAAMSGGAVTHVLAHPEVATHPLPRPSDRPPRRLSCSSGPSALLCEGPSRADKPSAEPRRRVSRGTRRSL